MRPSASKSYLRKEIFHFTVALHVKDQLEFGLERRIVDSEHCFHKFLLIDVIVTHTRFTAVHEVKEPLA